MLTIGLHLLQQWTCLAAKLHVLWIQIRPMCASRTFLVVSVLVPSKLERTQHCET